MDDDKDDDDDDGDDDGDDGDDEKWQNKMAKQFNFRPSFD